MTVQEFLTEYQTHYVPLIVDQARTKSCIKHLAAELGSLRLNEIGYSVLRQYRQTRKLSSVSESTINKELSILGSAFRWGREAELTDINPTIPRTRETPRAQSLTEAQIEKLASCAEDLKTEAYIRLLFLTGQRKTAVLQLKRSQIEAGMIKFQPEDDPMAHRRKRRAIIPVSKKIKAILDRLQEAYGKTDYVLPNGNSFYVRQLDVKLSEAAKKAGLPWVSGHILRHSTCSVLLAKGRSIEEASQYLGHSNIGITQKVYSHFRPDYLKEAANAL